MTRPTARGVALLAVAAATYVAARVLGTWELYLVALAFAAMTARRLGAWSLAGVAPAAGRPARHARAARSPATRCSSRSACGAARRVPGLQVTLHGRHRPAGRPVRAGRPGGPRARAGPHRHRRAVAGPARRPPPARRSLAVVEDPLGLVRARRPAGEPLRVTVAPRLDGARRRARRASDSGVRHGGGRRRLPTRDAWEFRGIRPHDPGEPLNRVDWKSTAKTGSLMLREMEAASEDDLTVLLSGAPACDAGRAAGQLLRDGRPRRRLHGRVHAPRAGTRSPCCCPSATGDRCGSRRTRRAAAGCSARWRRPSLPGRPGSARPCRPSSAAATQARRRVLALVVLCLDARPRERPGQAAAAGRRRLRGPRRRERRRAAPRDGDAGDLRRALAAAGVRYVRLARGGRPARGPGGGAGAAPGEGAMKRPARPALRGLLRRPRRDRGRRGRRASPTRRHVLLLVAVAAGDARRRARARPPARLAAGPAPAAARRLPAGAGAGARAAADATAPARTSPSTPEQLRAGGASPTPATSSRSTSPATADAAAAALAGRLRGGGRGRVPRAQPAPAAAGDRRSSSSWPASASPPTSRRATPGPRWPSSCWPAACSPLSRSLQARAPGARPTRSPAGSPPSLAAVLALSDPGRDDGGGRPAAQDWRSGTSSAPASRTSASTRCRTTRGCSTPPTTRWSCASGRPSPRTGGPTSLDQLRRRPAGAAAPRTAAARARA